MQTACYTDVGGREGNEDSVQVLEQGHSLCLVVADGLGGHGGGSIASKAVTDTVCGGWDGSADSQLLVHLANQSHLAVKQHQTRACSMKSTLVALALCHNRAAWAHVGDSRLYRFCNGKLEFQTRDHSASQLAVMLGDITPDQIRFHEDRSKILRALGQEGDVKVEAGSALLHDGSYAFLLCTDGFWEYVLESEMEEDLHAASDPQDWIRRMRSRLARRIPLDNDNNTAAAAWLDLN